MRHYYFEPVETLPEVGRRLSKAPFTFHALQRQLAPEEVLIGCYDRGSYKTAPLLTTEQEFLHFEEAHNAGLSSYREFYAVPQSAVEPTDRKELL